VASPRGADDVGAELAHQCLVRRRGVGDHGQPLALAELDRVAADRAGGSGHRERAPGLEREHVQREPDREPVHRQRRRLLDAGSRGSLRHRHRRHDDVLGLRAAERPRGRHDRDHALANSPIAASADGVDLARQLHARGPRRRKAAVALRERPRAHRDVGRVDGRRGDAHAHLARTGLGDVALDHLEHLGAAEAVQANRSHRRET
jgi:hypothetical protein